MSIDAPLAKALYIWALTLFALGFVVRYLKVRFEPRRFFYFPWHLAEYQEDFGWSVRPGGMRYLLVGATCFAALYAVFALLF